MPFPMQIDSKVDVFLDSPGIHEYATMRDWLRAAFTAFLNEGESFDGKRPLGNSGWENELEMKLSVAGGITIDDVIAHLFRPWDDR